MIAKEMKFGWHPFLSVKEKAKAWCGWEKLTSVKASRLRIRVKPAKVICFAAGACLLAVALAYAFYRSWWAVPFMFPAGGIWFVHSLREEKRKTLENGRGCFRDGMRSISAALSAGYSPENAVREASEELRHLYGEREVVVREFQLMVQKLNMNRPIETVLTEAAEELGLEDLQSFAEVFGVAKRSGGQLVSIIGDTVAVMEEKEQTQEELATIISGKMFEQQILTIFPLGLIAYLNLSADGFFHILYTTVMGRIVMTICLFIYLAAVGLAWKIGKIRV